MARCCGAGSCNCLVQATGAHTTVTGSGTATDPYLINAIVGLSVLDTTTFDLTLTGAGTVASPWVLSTGYAATAKLNQIPDVNAPTPTNTQVLGWDSATSKWTPRAPTTAASGSVTHDTSMSGDGSGGLPLQINEDAAGFLVTAAGGLGLSVSGKNRLVMHYATSGTRTSLAPSPELNTLSVLDSVPGRIDYWTGTVWSEYGQFTPDYTGGQMFALSGSYVSTLKLSLMVRQISATTDSSGFFDVLSAADLTGKAGVLGAWFQPTSSTVYQAILTNNITKVSGVAYRLSDGVVHASQPVAGVVMALIY